MAPFEIRETPDATIIHVAQDLDIATSPDLEKAIAIAEARAKKIVVSLEHCTYCDSSALGVLIRTKKHLGDRLVTVVPIENRARRIFEITGLVAALEICDAWPESLASMAS